MWLKLGPNGLFMNTQWAHGFLSRGISSLVQWPLIAKKESGSYGYYE